MSDPAESAFRRHYGDVYRYVRRRSPSAHDAEELTQSVFADAAAALPRFRPGATPVLAWLYTVAARRLADRARRADATVELEDLAAPSPEFGPDVARALARAIAALPETQRRVVVLKLLEGRPFAEIATRLDTTEHACRMRLTRALAALRAQLEQEGITP
jgi:RNA polymerase sigma-70 factor (ECF subfamily)